MKESDWLLLLAALAFLTIPALQRRSRARRGHAGGNGRDAGSGGRSFETAPSDSAPRPGKTERLLRAAGWRLPKELYMATVIVASFAAGLTAWNFFKGMPAAALVAAVMVPYILHSLLTELAVDRATRFEGQLIGALDLMISALEAGENPQQAIHGAGAMSPNPLRREFVEIESRLRMGMPIARALSRMAAAYDSEGVRMFCSTLVAKWDVGGRLSPVLAAAGRIMRERMHYRIHLKGQLSGAQVSSMLVAASPYIVLGIYAWRKPEWLETLLTNPLGVALLFSTICLQVVGFLWIMRILRTEM